MKWFLTYFWKNNQNMYDEVQKIYEKITVCSKKKEIFGKTKLFSQFLPADQQEQKQFNANYKNA